VARAMCRSARQQRLAVPELPAAALDEHPFTAFNVWLDGFEQALEERGLSALLALDEFEVLDTVVTRGPFESADILRTLRHLIQHRERFKVLLAGSHTLEEFRHWAGYLINLQVIKISYLDEQAARSLIESPVPDFSLRYDPGATEAILSLTSGHPHLVQLLCHEIVDLKNQQLSQRRIVLPDDVEQAVPQALAHGDFFFADIRRQVGPDAALALQILALQGHGVAIGRAELAAAMTMDEQQLDTCLHLLQLRDLIESCPGGYRFQVELIRRWFAAQAAPATARAVGQLPFA
jgi:hypothetical protein